MTVRKKTLLLFLSLLATLPVQAAPEPYRITHLLLPFTRTADPSRMTRAVVVKIIDGDTVQVKIDDPPAGLSRRETVRLVGVDTPETVDRRKQAQAFGKEASAYVRERLRGRTVLLAFDRDLRDVYRRLLAYVFLEDGTCFDLELIDKGYGFAYLKYPFFFMDEFRNAELAARYAHRGLWGDR